MFPKQQHSNKLEFLKPALMRWAFSCGEEDAALTAGRGERRSGAALMASLASLV